MKYANQIGCFYIEVSAKINLNVEKLFEEIAYKLPKKSGKNENIVIDDNFPPDNPGKCQSC